MESSNIPDVESLLFPFLHNFIGQPQPLDIFTNSLSPTPPSTNRLPPFIIISSSPILYIPSASLSLSNLLPDPSMEYYTVLGVRTDASDEEIRRSYRKLAMQWHPDKWATTPSLLGEANQKFQQIQEAYSVLSDRSKRMMYDAGLYNRDDDEEDTEGFADFLEEMMSLMNDAQEEEKMYSISELQSMFWEMAQDFEIPEWEKWLCGQSNFTYESGNTSWEPSPSEPNLGTHHLCT